MGVLTKIKTLLKIKTKTIVKQKAGDNSVQIVVGGVDDSENNKI